ncbi:NADH pyrophosphatase [Apiospora saccharicola]|uniref:NAD(+) diphosphatase n=1 Tax=Apiospora saccharicola TaxID=335842 RepID=A0ABR1WFU0_9PEZI
MTAPTPDLPNLVADDSMLSRKFGRETANYFSGSPLNRVSFLRSDHAFLASAFSHPTASFLPMNNLSPAVKDASSLGYVTKAEIEPLTGAEPFKQTEEEWVKSFSSDVISPVILFLGLDEKKTTGFEFKDFKGAPYFAIDVTPKDSLSEKANSVIEAVKAKGLDFSKSARMMSLTAPEAAIYAQARSLLDWNARNPFCAGCGGRTLSVNSGHKRRCPPTDLAGVPEGNPPKERGDCPTRHSVSNLCFPRTDPTIIVAVVSADGTKMLLGRNKRFPPDWYSTLAGFLEPGESIEEAVRREVWEESGVTAGRVVLHSSQPWPYPANLMIGAIAQATPDGETIDLGNDPELEDAKWFTMEEVRDALTTGVSDLGGPAPSTYKEGGLRLPPQTAIANRLIDSVCGGYLAAVSKI